MKKSRMPGRNISSYISGEKIEKTRFKRLLLPAYQGSTGKFNIYQRTCSDIF